jgi:hypothetical protein
MLGLQLQFNCSDDQIPPNVQYAEQFKIQQQLNKVMKMIYGAKRLTGDVTEKSIRHYRTVDIVEISEIQFLEIDHFRDMSKSGQINSQ